MCGIAGFVGDFIPGLAARMNALQAHRGPDGAGVYEDAAAQVALGHVRLAILDLSEQASQPMQSASGRFSLIYNGEIYNFADLRQRLEERGHTFKSTGDTEVLLHGLEDEGEGFLDRLNGIFALALWDHQERQLLLARDHMGVKPLYYTEPRPGTLLFASEIKALCAFPDLRREPDLGVIQEHLAYCHGASEGTALRGIKRLRPGHLLRWRADTRDYTLKRYWRLSFTPHYVDPRDTAPQELRQLLEQATLRQLVADVPVGSFLSGGLDSSLITALARSRGGPSFRCYTISYPSSENILDAADEDAPHARRLARELGLPFHEIEIKPEVASLWPKLIYHLDEPVADPAAISCYLISKLARAGGSTVLLSGQGSDELFCGYPRYRALYSTRWLDRFPRPARRLLSAGARILPGAREGRFGATLRRVRRVAAALGETPDERFLSYCAGSPEHEITRLRSAESQAALGGSRYKDACLAHMSDARLTGLERHQERDLSVYLPNHNLLYTDKMSMAVGLEVRVPFLDLELVNAAGRYPTSWKLAGGVTKAVLREAARGVVPDEIIHRRKAGFGAPYRKWLRYDLAEMWHDVLSESAVRRRGWFDYAALQDARQRSQDGRVDLYLLQWAVLTVELWAREFLDKNPVSV